MPRLPFSRRAFFRQTLKLGAHLGIASAGSLGYGSMVEPYWLDLRRLEVPLPHLDPALDGLRLVQLSDLHLEPHTTADQIHHAVGRTLALKPDLILLTGDFVTNSNRSIGRLAEILAQLHAPLGVYASLGNHDVWHDGARIARTLSAQKIPVLRNDGIDLPVSRGRLHLAGLDSVWAGRPSLKDTLRRWQPGQPLILMAHEPDSIDQTAARGITGLQLSGHTHGGQVCLPFWPPVAMRLPKFGRNYVAGSYTVGGMQLYVNRGIGCVGLPIRFSCPPEITEITLRAANGSPSESRPQPAMRALRA